MDVAPISLFNLARSKNPFGTTHDHLTYRWIPGASTFPTTDERSQGVLPRREWWKQQEENGEFKQVKRRRGKWGDDSEQKNENKDNDKNKDKDGMMAAPAVTTAVASVVAASAVRSTVRQVALQDKVAIQLGGLWYPGTVSGLHKRSRGGKGKGKAKGKGKKR